MKRSIQMSAALTVGSQPAHSINHNNPYITERSTPMNGTLITPSFTSLYGQTEIDPLSLHGLTGDHSDDMDLDMVRRMYHAKVQEAIRLIRPLWTVTLDGAVYCDYDWQPLTENEAEELHDMIDVIDVDAILLAFTR
ncbi:hypothetical protein PHL163M00_43 [Propionibacterium phage PHL163M00]|uniref:Uncharacterized protein n=4 Tax=Pahexavirus TaxID=1982251 RepID=A0A0E3DNF5_9CAUD|nr:hypothetical protein PHL194M00_42 [Propionibacterium phage PHL194M00]YP_009153246.1 hypothetical protein ACQ81_gp42 [Propionibacterium phage PHL055N00]YP_009153600.1 hypothetical protein PHL117M00_42 [Propionibacterium phage PHL117M00]YP_009153917.1 hypothetical protein PHL163M00_43 [Propionibacterium phage PHL163M00]AII28803.1 hypothetical protein PHL055N00_42 [Propionibacterium phage PHL055N00]AII29532.1 hypothetical protein PHL117M00_42 [Propionibacterium phage PHL117M00]AII29893.1 hypo